MTSITKRIQNDGLFQVATSKKGILFIAAMIPYFYLMQNISLAVSLFGLNLLNYQDQFHFLPFAVQIILTLIGIMTFFYAGKFRDYQKDMINLHGKLADFALEVDEKDKETKLLHLERVLKDFESVVHLSSRNTKMCVTLSFGLILILATPVKDIMLGQIKNPEDMAKGLLSILWGLILFVLLFVYFEHIMTIHQNELLRLNGLIVNTKHTIRTYKNQGEKYSSK